jgi:hypothetical protein
VLQVSFSNFRNVLLLSLIASFAGAPANAAWPWTKFEGSPRIDPIPPIGNRLPPSYRRKYNRPTYIGGKIAAKIEPSSQEAMAFHRSESLGLYDHTGIKGLFSGKHCPPQRVEQHYFYPKPWEALMVGPRRDVTKDNLPQPVRVPMKEGLIEDDTREPLSDQAMELGSGPAMVGPANMGPENMKLPAAEPSGDLAEPLGNESYSTSK